MVVGRQWLSGANAAQWVSSGAVGRVRAAGATLRNGILGAPPTSVVNYSVPPGLARKSVVCSQLGVADSLPLSHLHSACD